MPGLMHGEFSAHPGSLPTGRAGLGSGWVSPRCSAQVSVAFADCAVRAPIVLLLLSPSDMWKPMLSLEQVKKVCTHLPL